MKMTKKKVLWTIFALLLVLSLSVGAVLYVPNFKGGNASIGGEIMTDTTKTPQEYLSIINNYSKENTNLQSQLASNKAMYESDIASYKQEILTLQEELNNTKEEDTEIIAEKKARIDTLTETISVLISEKNEIVADLEAQIADLQKKIADAQIKVIQTITLPEGFVFENLGFSIIDENSFVFYSKTTSCNLYFYDLLTQETITIPFKSIDFDSFYKVDNLLFFRSSNMIYIFDFLGNEISLLGSCANKIQFAHDDNYVYMLSVDKGYGIYNRETNTLLNCFSSITDLSSDGLLIFDCDDYIFYHSYIMVGKTRKILTSLFNKSTYEFITLDDTATSIFVNFIDFVDGDLIYIYDNAFYKVDSTNLTSIKLGDFFGSSFTTQVVDDILFFFTTNSFYLYQNHEFKVVLEQQSKNFYGSWDFTKIDEETYYLISSVDRKSYSSSVYWAGFYKLDLTSLSFDCLFPDAFYLKDSYIVNNYKILCCYNYVLFIDLDTGTISNSSFGASYSLDIISNENYLFFCALNNESRFLVFDKQSNSYSIVSIGYKVYEVKLKESRLYVLTSGQFLIYDFAQSLNKSIINLYVVGSISSLEDGIFYSKVGALDGADLYIKYILQDNDTFIKELVVI